MVWKTWPLSVPQLDTERCRENKTRVTSTPPSPRVSVFAQAFTISANLEPWTGGKNSGSYMPQESLIVKKEKPENPYYFHT